MTGWPVQLFHGPSNAQPLANLFADRMRAGLLTLTSVGTDHMNWRRLSTIMLLPTFWRAVIGERVLVFQPDTAMCASSTARFSDFYRYGYVGPPMGGPYWRRGDEGHQWSVGGGGFSLRSRSLTLKQVLAPGCILPASQQVEDQQLAATFEAIKRRCRRSGIEVLKPDRFEAVRFAVEYDLYMDVLPGEGRGLGCTAYYHDSEKHLWHPRPRPPRKRCPRPQFVPVACHKCWKWNFRTWNFMRVHCPESLMARTLAKLYPEPKPTHVDKSGKLTLPNGPVRPDARWLPIDIREGRCHGNCSFDPKHREWQTR